MSPKLTSLTLGLIVFLSVNSAFATKCLKGQTMDELKKDFPIIVRGKVTDRKKSLKGEDTFLLVFHVEKVIQGKLKPKELKATEVHYGKDFWKSYEVGKEYTFLITPKKKNGYEVTLPMDGCPDLPAE